MVVRKVQELFGKAANRSVNPDEVVAMGAAIQGGVLAGDVTSMLLLDVTPLTLGIETLGGVMTKMIERNTTIPHSKTEVYSTAADNQTAVDVYVFQGERQMARDNKLIGNFRLSDLPPAPRGMPQVEVTFDIDANGILSVKAKDKATGKEQRITIEASSGLSESEIKNMVNDAKAHEAEDAAKKELIEARNQLDSRIYEVEKTLGEHGAKLPEGEKTAVEAELVKARDAKDKDDIQLVKSCLESLTAASHKLAQVMYESQGASGGAPDDGGKSAGGGGNDDVIDAEYEDA
jgi:molecular chaperone DnaK